MIFYLRQLRADQRAVERVMRERLANPWGKPRFLRAITVVYVIWSLAPVLLAVRFAFNDGRSRTSSQGWSFRWLWGDHEPVRLRRPDAAGGARSTA